MYSYYLMLCLLATSSCFKLVAETLNGGGGVVKWKFLAIDIKNQSAVKKLNEDIIFTVVAGHSPSKSLDREIILQKNTRQYQEIIDRVSNNKRNDSTVFTKANHDILSVGINLSCFVGGVFLPEMAIAIRNGNGPLFFKRFEQTLFMLPFSKGAYSFVIAPLFSLVPQCAYYSNISINTIKHISNTTENLLKKYKVVFDKKLNITAEKSYFLRKNIISLETLRVNLFLMGFYQQNKRWPTEDETKIFPLLFATKLNYHSSNGSFSYKLFFSSLRMMSEVNGMPEEKDEKLIIKKVIEWVPFKVSQI